MADLHGQTYALGRAYGLMAAALPQIIDTPGRVRAASINPMLGNVEASRLMYDNHAMSDRLNEQLVEVMAEVEVDYPAETARLPGGTANSWFMGYYAGKADV